MIPRTFHLVKGDVRRVNRYGQDVETHLWLTAKELGPELDRCRRKAKKDPCFWYELRND